ncbi:hypothetical protein YC2023_108564 [Brassica napus]
MDGAEARDLYPAIGARARPRSNYSNENFEGRRGDRFHVNGTCTWVSRSYESGETRLIALMRELRKGIRLKLRNRDLAVDGNVRKSGDVGSSGWKSTAHHVVSGAFSAALENPEDRVPLTPGKGSRQNGSIISGKGLALRAGLGGPNWERLFRDLSPGVEQPTQNGETTAKGMGLAESAGKEDPVELDSSPTL